MKGPPRRLGARSAANRARLLAKGQDLPAHKLAIVDVTARLLVHSMNISNQLYVLGEMESDEAPRALLRELRELSGLVLGNMKYVFGQDGGDQDTLLRRFR